MENNNKNNLKKLTAKSYLDLSTEYSKDVKSTKTELTSLNVKFDDNNKNILMAKDEIARLKQYIADLQDENALIRHEIRDKKYLLRSYTNFLKKLNTKVASKKNYCIDLNKLKFKAIKNR